MRSINYFLMCLAILVFSLFEAKAVTYFYQAAMGPPHLTASWNTMPGGGGSPPTNFNTAGDLFIIPTGRTAVLVDDWLLGSGGVGVDLQIDGTLNMGGAFTLAIYGQYNQPAGGQLIGHPSATLRLFGNAASCMTFSTNLNLGLLYLGATYTGGLGLGSSLTVSSLAVLAGILTVNACNTNTVLTLAGGTTINGSLDVNNTGTLNTQAVAIVGTGAFNLNAGATIQTSHPDGFNGGTIQVTGGRTWSLTGNYIFTPPTGADRDINIATPQINNLTTIGPGFTRVNSPIQVNGIFTQNGRVVVCGSDVILQGAGPHIINNEMWIGQGNFTVNGVANVTATGVINLVGLDGCGGNGNVNGTGTINYAVGATLSVSARWTGTIDLPELPPMMNGNILWGGGTAPGSAITLGVNTQVNGSFTINGATNFSVGANTLRLNGTPNVNNGIINVPNMGRIVVVNGRTLNNANALNINAGGTLEIDGAGDVTGNTVFYDATGLRGTLLYTGGGVVTTPAAVFPATMSGNVTLNKTPGTTLRMTGTKTIGGALAMQAGIFDIGNIVQTLTLNGAYTRTAARFDAAGNAASLVLNTPVTAGGGLVWDAQRDLRTLTVNPGAGQTVRLGSDMNATDLQIQTGTFDTFTTTFTLVGPTPPSSIAAMTTLNVGTGGRFIVQNGADITNNGAFTINGGATLEIQGTGNVSGGVDVNYVNAMALLQYTGMAAKTTTREFPNTMLGSVEVANSGTITQAAGPTTKAVSGMFSFIGNGIYSMNNVAGNALVLNGGLTNTATGEFLAYINNNLSINGAVTNPIRFNAAARTLNNFTLGTASGNVFIGTDLSVNGTLTMEGGNLTANTLLQLGNTAPASLVSGAGFGVTRAIYGDFRRQTAAVGSYLFPRVAGGVYMPATLNDPGAPATVRFTPDNTAFTSPGPHTGISSIFGNDGSWQMDVFAGNVGGPTTTVTVRPLTAPATTTAVGFAVGNRTNPYTGLGGTVAPPNVSSNAGGALTASNVTRFFAVGNGVLPPTNMVFSAIMNTSFSVSFTAASPTPTGYLLVRRLASAGATNPVNGINYTVGMMIGMGTVIGNITTPMVINTAGLLVGTTYAVDIYSYTGTVATPTFSTGQVLTGTVTTTGGPGCATVAPPTTVNTTILERAITFTGVSITGGGVLAGNGTNYVFVPPSSPLTLNFNYQSNPAGSYCPGCITQIYVGINETPTVNNFRHCISPFAQSTPLTPSPAINFTSPAAPGVYYINLGGTWDFSCQPIGFPTTSQPNTLGVVIVGTPPCVNFSDVIPDPFFTPPTAIPYIPHVAPTVAATMPTLWRFRLRDGGTTGIPMTDDDNLPTVLEQVTISLSNPAPLNRIALYNAAGTVKLDEQPAAASVTFTIPAALRPANATAADNNFVDFVLKGSYLSVQTDNAAMTFSITNAVSELFAPAAPRSTIANPAALVGPSGISTVAVVADRPSWTALTSVQPTTVGLSPLENTPAPAVTAVDALGNRDVDFVGPIQISNPPSLVGGPLSVNALAGVATFGGANSIRHSTNGTMQVTATLGANTALSNMFTVQPALLTIAPATVNFGNRAIGEMVEQSFTLTGNSLPTNGLLQFAVAHPDLSLSLLGGGAFATVGTITLTPTPAAPNQPLGSALTQTFFVRYRPTSNSALNGVISGAFTGSASAAATLTGQGMSTFVTTASTPINFGNIFAGASADRFFSVSANNISGPLTITASTGAVLSTTGSAPFSSTLTIYPSANTIPITSILARLTAPNAGVTYTGTIAFTNFSTVATVVSWQGVGINPTPTALGFASSMENVSTATGGVPGAIQDSIPVTIQSAAFRPDGVMDNATLGVQLQAFAAPGGTASFVVLNGAGNYTSTQRLTQTNVRFLWTNAPLAGGTTTAIVRLVRVSGDVLQATEARITITKGPTIPSISGLTPQLIGSGSSLTILGNNFAGTTTVTIGGFPAASFTINSINRITAIVGQLGGSGDVEVRTPGGIARTRTMSNSSDTVEYFRVPIITDYSPKEARGGDAITIFGENFPPSANVSFGGIPAQAVTVNNRNQLTAVVSGFGENGLLRLQTIGGSTAATVPFSFVREPEILSVNPKLGTLGTEIVVTGANFKALTEVWLAGVRVTQATVRVVSENELRFNVPAPVSGPVTVRNTAGVDVSDDVFTYVFPPEITSVTPDSGSVGNQVTIRGANFLGVTTMTVGGVEPLRTFVVSTTQIIAILGRGDTGTQPILLQTIGGVTNSSVRFTFINPPQVSQIRPLVGGPRTVITVTGANFNAIDRVTIGGLDVRGYEVISTTQIVAVVSDAGGSGQVQVSNRLGASTSREFFRFYFPPKVQRFEPFEGSTGSTITITGEHFVNATSTVVTIGGVPVADFVVESPTTITAIIGTGATGRVAVRTDGGFEESLQMFRFVPPRETPPPIITNFSPDSAAPDDIVRVEGLNFINVRRVRLGATTIATFTVNSPTTLSFVMPVGVSSGTLEVQTTTGTAFARRVLTAIPPRVILTPLQRDSLALVQLYNTTDGINWTRRRNWLTTQPISSWQGVLVENARVVQIALDSAGLLGRLPVQFGNLTALRRLSLSGNTLQGAFPDVLTLMPNLQELTLSDNQLEGGIPAGIGSMTGLTVLRLSNNRFSGVLPAEICIMGNLREINLSGNQLTGTLPACLARLTALERLDLSNNRFVGGIPTDFAAMTLLRELLLNNNFLNEALPRSIWATTTRLLAENSGENNAEKGSSVLANTGLRSLTKLNLSNNQIIGEIPSELLNTASLQELLLANNTLRGTISSSIGLLGNLRVLDLSQNTLTGSIPASVRDLRQMERLALGRNQLSGAIPAEIAQMLNLRELSLENNQLSGALPEALSNLGRLQIIRVQNNRLTGLPNLSAVTSLITLATENNRLQFESLEPNVRPGNTSFGFTYAPQDSVGEARDTVASVGLPFVLSTRMRAERNRYQWFKNGREIMGATNVGLPFAAFTRADTGSFSVRVTNDLVPGLTLFVRPTFVRAATAPIPANPPVLVSPSNEEQNVPLNAQFEWQSALGATSYDVQLATDPNFTQFLWDSTQSALQMRISQGVLRSFTRYFWRVRSRNESGVSAWSQARNFTSIDAGALVLVPTTDLGRAVVGGFRVGSMEITSVSDVPINLVGARIEGADAASFRIDTNTSRVRGVTIPPFGKYTIAINFVPQSEGAKEARLVLQISNGGATIERSGILRGTPSFVDVNTLNFDTVLAGFAKLRNMMIENLGRDTVRIRERITIFAANGKDTSDVFQIDAGSIRSSYVILPGNALILPVQAFSTRLGNVSGIARIQTTKEEILVNLSASVREPISSDVLLQLGVTTATASAPPGATVRFGIYRLRGTPREINGKGNPGYSLSIRMNPNVLIPAPGETKLVPQVARGVYRLEQPRIEFNGNDSTVISFACLVLAGDTAATEVEILDPRWNSPNIFILPSKNFPFKVAASRAGGLRLILPAPPKPRIAAIQPNPSDNDATISYSLQAASTLEILLFDARGNLLRNLLPPKEHSAGEHTFTFATRNLASGQYRIVLRTSAGTAQESLNVVK